MRFLKAVVAAAATVVAFGSTAEARINGPRLDSFSIGCGLLQDEADRLIDEYRNASEDRRGEILTRLREIGGTWIDIGCGSVFGNIAIGVGVQPRLPMLPVGDAMRMR